MEQTTSLLRNNINYEEWYHTKRHSSHFNDEYYTTRAEIALHKFFSDIDINQSILDFGCGLGQNICKLPNAVGFDISEFAVEFCRKRGIKATTNLSDLDDNSFDIVFSAHVMEHHPHPMTMLEDMFRKLKKNGKLILVIPYERHGKAQFQLDLNQHLYTWNFQAVNNLLLVTGYKILQNRYVYGAGYNKLLPLRKISFNLYKTSTIVLSRVVGIKEMMIITMKP